MVEYYFYFSWKKKFYKMIHWNWVPKNPDLKVLKRKQKGRKRVSAKRLEKDSVQSENWNKPHHVVSLKETSEFRGFYVMSLVISENIISDERKLRKGHQSLIQQTNF